MAQLVIDNEFKSLIPPLTDEEYKGLEESILKDGCRDALVVWGNILVDGHNRYDICQKHNIQFQTKSKNFATRDDVKLWMIGNQLARRNINKYARTTLESMSDEIKERKEKAKQKRLDSLKQNMNKHDNRFSNVAKTGDITKTINTTRDIAKKTGVGERTTSKVIKINKAINNAVSTGKEVAGQNPEVLKHSLMTGETSINEAYNKIKLEEKKAEIKRAERKIAEQADESEKPILRIGDGTTAEITDKYDLLLTDPPYSTDIDDINTFVDGWLFKALDNVKDTGFAYVFIGAYPDEIKAYLNARVPEHMKLSQLLVWTYKNTLGNNPKDRYKQNYQNCLFYRGINAPDLDCPITNEQWAVQEINAPDGRQGDRYHAWQKPMEIAERFVRHSTKRGQTIFDPFACTGTFLLAGAKLGRKAYGYEINPDNAKIAFDRGCVDGK